MSCEEESRENVCCAVNRWLRRVGLSFVWLRAQRGNGNGNHCHFGKVTRGAGSGAGSGIKKLIHRLHQRVSTDP